MGLGFAPVGGRDVADIEGTFWLDRRTAALRSLEFRYVGLDPAVPVEGASGRVELEALPDGAFYVRRWWIRTPVLAPARVAASPRLATDRPIATIREEGGRVLRVSRAGGAAATALPAAASPAATLDTVRVNASPGPAEATRSQRRDVVAGAELEAARVRGARVVDVIRRFPGISIREGRFDTGQEVGTGFCIESSHRVQRLIAPPHLRAQFCDMLPIFVDGRRMGGAISYLRGLEVDGFDSIELISATAAQIRFGMDAGAAGGAIVLRTRR